MLKLARTVLGDTHPLALDSMNNLAEVYRQQGKYAEAEALLQQIANATAEISTVNPSLPENGLQEASFVT
jgi:hypothetical protein